MKTARPLSNGYLKVLYSHIDTVPFICRNLRFPLQQRNELNTNTRLIWIEPIEVIKDTSRRLLLFFHDSGRYALITADPSDQNSFNSVLSDSFR